MRVVSALKAIAFLAVFAFAVSSFAQVKNVAVIETQIDERSGAASEINRAEVGVITSEIRREAVNNLPRGRYNVMTSETVQAMGSAVMEECAEENCVIALGSKIGADYIVRGLISKFRTMFTLSIEMYETEYGMLVVTAAPVRTANLDELLERAAAVCAEMYKDFLKMSSAASTPSVPQAVVTLPPPPPPPSAPVVTYTLKIDADPSSGGTVTRSPGRTSYASKTPVTVTAVPETGYRFTGWSGALTSKNPKETVVMDSNMTLTANFFRTYTLTVKAKPAGGGLVKRAPDRVRYDAGTPVTLTAIPAQGYLFNGWYGAVESKDSVITRTVNSNMSLTANFSKEPKKPSALRLTMRVSGAALAGVGFIGGAVYSSKANSEYDNYKVAGSSKEAKEARENSEKFAGTGNALYTLGWIGLSGLTVSLFF
jgi:uncharacterized repeat protein (TIGR02543 family)